MHALHVRRRFRVCTWIVAICAFAGAELRGAESATEDRTITLESLLNEMVDRDAIARWPEPQFTCLQQSSYDRHRVSPDKPGWFANKDYSNYLRTEKNGQREEHVMMDADGPGALVRFWITTIKIDGTIRVYLDNEEEPTLVFDGYDLLKGNFGFDLSPPFATPHTSYKGNFGGSTLYLPIPFVKHCKITFETADDYPGRFYHVNYRVYPAGTKVETFTLESLDAARPLLDKVGKELLNPPAVPSTKNISVTHPLDPEQSESLELPHGSAAIRQLKIDLSTESGRRLTAQELRATVLQMEFDGQRTVWCPVSDFAGSGVGSQQVAGWYRDVNENGTCTCRWVMPYEKTARITVTNYGKQKVIADLVADVGSWQWDHRSMYFHTTWRQEAKVPAKDYVDWNLLTVKGSGVYVGDTLAVFNPLAIWYGEGNEKIWVDKDTFPSHLGTGTEDYFNASWAPVIPFQTPFASAPRADNPSSQGHNTFTRTRNLDGIPFEESLRFDWEVIPWKPDATPGMIDYAATTYWYGRPGAMATQGPMPQEVVRPLGEVSADAKE